MFFLGSAYPLGKFGLNSSMNPIFFGALRMGFVFLCLLPFCKIIIPKKKYILPLIGFSLCMGAGVNMFLYLSINAVTLLGSYNDWCTIIYTICNINKFFIFKREY
jgi:O-acetylserine/cysteine efflux transporter